jgi:hypothetical protein
MGRSSFDGVRQHLRGPGPDAPVPPELRRDLVALVRRWEEAKQQGGACAQVQLSPFMKSLLRVSIVDAPESFPGLVSDLPAFAG